MASTDLMNYSTEYQDEKVYTTIDKILDPHRIWSDLVVENNDLAFEDSKYKVSCRLDGIVGYPDAIAKAFCGSAFNEYMEECAAPSCYLYYYDRIWKPSEEVDSKYQFCAKYGNYQSDLEDEEQEAQELVGVKRKYINYISHTGITGMTTSKINWYVRVNEYNCDYWPRDTFSDNIGWNRYGKSIGSQTDSLCACIDTDSESVRLVITILFNGAVVTRDKVRNGFPKKITASLTPDVDTNCTSIYTAWKNGTLSSLTINNAVYASLDSVTSSGTITHLWDNTDTTDMLYTMCGKIPADYRVHVPGFQGILTAQFLDYDQAQTEINLGYDSQINPKLIFRTDDSEFLGKTEANCINAVPRKEYAQIRKVLMIDLLNNNRYADNALRVYAVGTSNNYKDVIQNNLLVPKVSMGCDWTNSAVEISFPAAEAIGSTEVASGPNQVLYQDKIGATIKKHYIRLDKLDEENKVSYTNLSLKDEYTISLSAVFKLANSGECVFQCDNMKLYFLSSDTSEFVTATGTATARALKLVTPTQQIIEGISASESWSAPTKATLSYKNGLWGIKVSYGEYNT